MKSNQDMLFSEVFSTYYRVIAKIMNEGPMNDQKLQKLIKEQCYDESDLFLSDIIEKCDFINKDNQENCWQSSFNGKIIQPLSKIEKSWLKTIIQDPKFRLFVDDKIINELKLYLDDVEVLYDDSLFHNFDMITDCEEYSSQEYINIFRQLNRIIDAKETMTISYESIRGNLYSFTCVPLKIEYSHKSQKFRLLSIMLKDGKPQYLACHNLNRIKKILSTEKTTVTVTRDPYAEEFYFEPIEVKVKNDRSAVMRFLIEFSTYRKESIIDAETGDCTSKLYYHLAEESEIITKILSFSPNIKVLSPGNVIEQIKAVLIKQQKLLKRH